MKRHALMMMMGLIALLTVFAAGQGEDDISALFPSQEAIQQLLEDERWVLGNLVGIAGGPADALAASANFESPTSRLQIAIFDFFQAEQPPARALEFGETFLTSQALRAEPEDVTELINTTPEGEPRENAVELAVFLQLDDDVQNNAIVMVEEAVFVLIKGPFSQPDLVRIAQFQVDHLAEVAQAE